MTSGQLQVDCYKDGLLEAANSLNTTNNVLTGCNLGAPRGAISLIIMTSEYLGAKTEKGLNW